MSDRVDYSTFGKRRPVRGGVESRSQRGGFATTRWGRAFLEAVEQVADRGRLTRGRTYARAGQVVSYHLEPGAVHAEVQGSQPRPFTAVLTMRQLRDDRLDELVDVVRQTPGMLAEIASGTLPSALGSLILPTTASELDFACSCPDSGWPCKHVAAVCYILAERLDDHPKDLLTLRGVDLETLIGAVQRDSAPPDPVDLYGEESALPALPRPDFHPAPEDLDPALLRRALRMTAEDEPTAEAGLHHLRALYRALR
ncbi:SWIM zinc finger family protein [Nocardia otitidiscaviarum]|uniref:SWIM zinc finger family protein n=1 Tax=Nocardia otitidiscaviarum TaxID=1823 RepID=UPI001893C3C9|nr:SWIM zinc finger family protein [Nocardia otitidiscaviarum]MBF6235516.1 SWIM zinc finger family protein [Nocardia otitidiscaviarum]